MDIIHLEHNPPINKQLSEEFIEAIYEEAKEQYSGIESESGIICISRGMTEALTNPEIYTKADLISKENALLFGHWMASDDNIRRSIKNEDMWFYDTQLCTLEELFTFYKQTK